ncbi:MAG: ROK family protein [Candidatus Woykebacteria bacterium]
MYIGIDIGGTHIRVAKGSGRKISEKVDFPTKTFAENRNEIANAVSKLGSDGVKMVGVSAPGPIGYRDSKIIDPNKFTGWTGMDLKKELSEALNLPVVVGHDASLACLAEYTYGEQKNKDPLLYITVSTGIGLGVVEDGKLRHGLYYPHAGHQFLGEGEIKCWCGQDSDLEASVSGWSLREKTGKAPREVEGTPVWYKAMDILSKGICNFIMSYSPEVVVIGGGMTNHGDIFFKPVKEGVNKYLKILPVPPIHPASLEEPGIVGALELAEQSLN